jgi:hypothetical protein
MPITPTHPFIELTRDPPPHVPITVAALAFELQHACDLDPDDLCVVAVDDGRIVVAKRTVTGYPIKPERSN